MKQSNLLHAVSPLSKNYMNKLQSRILMYKERLNMRIENLIIRRDELWECLECGKTNTVKRNIKIHAETHLGLKHTCKMCARIFSTTHTLKAHVDGLHSELYTCDLCGREGMAKSTYRSHIMK